MGIVGVLAEGAKRISGLPQPLAVKTSRLWVIQGPEGNVSLRATAVVDGLQVTVIDSGTWKTPRVDPGINRGRGITLMRGLMEDFTIHSNDAGTTVKLHARIT